MDRDIKNGSFGWYEKEAMKKIETLPFKRQASCKLIYIAICSLSSKQGNSNKIECYKFDIARCASVSEKTVQRYLKDIESIGIIKQTTQSRTNDGKYEKVEISLIANTLPVGHFGDTSETVGRQLGDTESDVLKKVINKESNKYNTSNEVMDKSDEPKKEYGNPEINSMIDRLKKELHRTDFSESTKWQRIYIKNIVSLGSKIGEEEFKRRIKFITGDEFKIKHCGSLKYFYGQLKSAPTTEGMISSATKGRKWTPEELKTIQEAMNRFGLRYSPTYQEAVEALNRPTK